MSHYIDTAHAPHGGLGRLSGRQRWEILIGIVAVVTLCVAAFAFVNNAESPVDDLVVPSAVQPVGSSSSAIVSHGVLDPFEMRLVSSPVVGASSLAIVSHGVLDPFEMRLVSSPVVDASSDLIGEGAAYPRPEFR